MRQNHYYYYLLLQLKYGKTFEKLLMSMVNLRKNILWWWSSDGKTIEKPSKAMWCPENKLENLKATLVRNSAHSLTNSQG